MKDLYITLTLLIPRPQARGKYIDVFLRPLVDKLKELWASRVQTKDANSNIIFNIHTVLLWTINDFST